MTEVAATLGTGNYLNAALRCKATHRQAIAAAQASL
jgi:hypothetical protein